MSQENPNRDSDNLLIVMFLKMQIRLCSFYYCNIEEEIGRYNYRRYRNYVTVSIKSC
jgi:hypothetical protein